jgi:hypothetical protein
MLISWEARRRHSRIGRVAQVSRLLRSRHREPRRRKEVYATIGWGLAHGETQGRTDSA